MARLSNTALKRKARKGCRANFYSTDEAALYLSAARQCGDRRTAGRIRRTMGA